MKRLFFLLISCLLLISASEVKYFEVNGIVKDIDDNPIGGAKIIVVGTEIQSLSKLKTGKFKLRNVPSDHTTFKISKSGYKSRTVIISDLNKFIVITLKKIGKSADGEIDYDMGGFSSDIELSDKYVSRSSSSESTEALMVGEMDLREAASISINHLNIEKFSKTSDISKKSNNEIGSGKLTAGEINDYSKWNLWNDLKDNEFAEYSREWRFKVNQRYIVALKNKQDNPIFGAKVILYSNGNKIWETITDNTGKAELWNLPFDDLSSNKSNNLSAEIQLGGKFYNINDLIEFHQGINFLEIDYLCQTPQLLDIAFLVDATGSMQDEIDFLKADLESIMNALQDSLPKMNINLASIFYRDIGDDYITKIFPFSSDIKKVVNFIKQNNASGGGDFPEAVHSGLHSAINQLEWRTDAVAKIIFMILDAPPHNDSIIIDSLQKLSVMAAKKGIRIIPVTCSGIEKGTEFLMRSMALLTNGTYTFLTDHSGIGNPHIEPSTDKYEVEIFNDLVKRLIIQYAHVPNCQSELIDGLVDTTMVLNQAGRGLDDTLSQTASFVMKIYPNPSYGIINIEFPPNTKEIFIADLTGKVMMKIPTGNISNISLDIGSLPNGIYFVMMETSPNKWLRGKFVLSR